MPAKSTLSEQALVTREPPAKQIAPASNSPADLMRAAAQSGMGAEQIRELMQLQRDYEANEARKAFNAAFAAFKAEAVTVYKSTVISDGPLKGKRHANLFDVVVATAGPLAKHGLSTSWKLTKDEPGLMEITCVLKHKDGHSETDSMSAAPDVGPGRNAIQARGSARKYLERYTLMGILGLAATDQDDDDGRGAHQPAPIERIDEEQQAKVREWIEASGTDQPKFLAWLGRQCKVTIEQIADIPANAYKLTIDTLKERDAAKKGKERAE